MDTPPYSDVSAQLSPGAHALHVNVDSHSSTATNSFPHGLSANGAIASMDLRSLHSATWAALDIPPPPTLRDILTAYKQKGDGDRDMLLAMLNAKSAEDQRIASQLSLRRTMLEINNQTTEPYTHPHPHPHPHHPLPHAPLSHGLGHHTYTYVPEESYTLPGPHQQHRIASSPSAPPHSYPSAYGRSHAPHAHAHLRAIDSPLPPTSAQKGAGALPALRSRGAVRLSDTRSPAHAQTQSQFQAQSQRRKRARRSRSRSPNVSPSHHPYAYVRSPHSVSYSHSRTHSEADPDLERSPYTSASDSGSIHGHGQGVGQGQGYPRTMAIGSLLSAGSNPNCGGPNGAATGGRVKEERAEREQVLEDEDEETWTLERARS